MSESTCIEHERRNCDACRSVCGKCGSEKSPDELTAEGTCFGCSTGDSEGFAVTAAEVRDSFKNIVKALGAKTGEFKATVRKEMCAAIKNQEN